MASVHHIRAKASGGGEDPNNKKIFWGDYHEELPPRAYELDPDDPANSGRHRRPHHDAYHNLHSRFRLGTTLMRIVGWELPDGSLNTEFLLKHGGLQRIEHPDGSKTLEYKPSLLRALDFLHEADDPEPREHFRWLISPFGIGRVEYRLEYLDELAGRRLDDVLQRQKEYFEMLHEHRGEARREQTSDWRKDWSRLWGRETLAEVALFHLPMLETSEGLLHEPSLTKYKRDGDPRKKQHMLPAYRRIARGNEPPMTYFERVLEHISGEEARASKIELLAGRSLTALQHRIREYEQFLMSTRYALNRPPNN